jgi:hypothetical protein
MGSLGELRGLKDNYLANSKGQISENFKGDFNNPKATQRGHEGGCEAGMDIMAGDACGRCEEGIGASQPHLKKYVFNQNLVSVRYIL